MSRADWLAALREATRVEDAPFWLPIAAARPLGGELFELRYRPATVRRSALHGDDCRLDSTVEGGGCWIGKPHAKELVGAVRTVLEGEGALTIVRRTGRPPAPQDHLHIRPPAFLEPALKWLEAHPQIGADPRGPDAPMSDRLRAPLPTGTQAPQGKGRGAGPPPTADASAGLRLRAKQAEAVRLAGARLGVCWGPPGTGKTTTLAALVSSLVAQGQRVLVVAPTRVAADGACLAIDRHWPAQRTRRRGDLLRTQLPQLVADFQRQRPDLLIWSDEERAYTQAQIDLQKADQMSRQQILLKSGLARDAALVQAATVANALDALRDRWQTRQDELVREAQVVVSTVRSAINRALPGTFTHLIVDEASMVSRSDGLLLEAQQRDSLGDAGSCLLFGDHKQLGPVPPLADNVGEGEVSEEAPRPSAAALAGWFERDMLTTVMELPGAPARTVMLDEQSRMNPALCAVVSAQSYHGALRSTPEAPAGGLPPGLPAGICLLDPLQPPAAVAHTLRAHPASFVKVSGPGLQPQSAAHTVALARLLVGCGVRVLVCTPFRAQATLIRRGLADLTELRAGTVHRLQGQEASVCIFDPGQAASPFIKSSPVAARLVNVAASRAQDVLVISNAPEFLAKNPLLMPYLKAATPLSTAQVAAGRSFVTPKP